MTHQLEAGYRPGGRTGSQDEAPLLGPCEAARRLASFSGGLSRASSSVMAVKAKDDLRQEQLASQFFTLAHRILKESRLGSRAGLR